MSNKQQTAVEWLENQLKLRPSDWIEVHPYFEQAKEMQKEQTMDFAFNALKIADDTINRYIDVDKLYNETYGGNK